MVTDTSLANLQPGNRKGSKNKITKAIALKLVEYMDEDFVTFTEEIAQLAPRDRVAAKLKLLSLVLPKQHEVEVEAIDTSKKWEIRRASQALKEEQTSAELVEEAEVVETQVAAETPVGDPNQLLLDFTPTEEVGEAAEPEATPVAAVVPAVTIRRASQSK
jgi:hypothetical protein